MVCDGTGVRVLATEIVRDRLGDLVMAGDGAGDRGRDNVFAIVTVRV
jgi:hypothetical protein